MTAFVTASETARPTPSTCSSLALRSAASEVTNRLASGTDSATAGRVQWPLPVMQIMARSPPLSTPSTPPPTVAFAEGFDPPAPGIATEVLAAIATFGGRAWLPATDREPKHEAAEVAARVQRPCDRVLLGGRTRLGLGTRRERDDRPRGDDDHGRQIVARR